MLTNTVYILGDIVNGDYDEQYDDYEAAKEAYDDYVEDGFKANHDRDEALGDDAPQDEVSPEEFFYIRKNTSEIIVGGDEEC